MVEIITLADKSSLLLKCYSFYKSYRNLPNLCLVAYALIIITGYYLFQPFILSDLWLIVEQLFISLLLFQKLIFHNLLTSLGWTLVKLTEKVINKNLLGIYHPILSFIVVYAYFMKYAKYVILKQHNLQIAYAWLKMETQIDRQVWRATTVTIFRIRTMCV